MNEATLARRINSCLTSLAVLVTAMFIFSPNPFLVTIALIVSLFFFLTTIAYSRIEAAWN